MINFFMGSKFKANCRQLLATLAANLVSFSFGVYTGWPATVSPTLISSDTPLKTILTEDSISWACSWGMLSAILGAFFWGLLADKYGRKVTGFLTMLPYLIGWIVLLAFKTEPALMVSRFLGGLGASGAAINTPMYVGEITDKKTKAGLGSLFMLMYNIGVLYVYVFGVFVGYDALNIACLAVSVLYMAVWCCVPESPVFLIRQRKTDEATESLKWFRGEDNDKEIEEEIDSLTRDCGNHLTTATLSDYCKPATVKALLIGIMFQTGTQFSGINIILMDTVNIFRQSGSNLSAETCIIMVGIVQVIGSVIALCVVNKAGRKFFLITTYMLTALALITIGSCFYVKQINHLSNTGLLPVLSLSVHVTAFSIGLGMVPYIVYPEIFSANVRNVCMSVLMLWNNALGFGVIKAYPFMSKTLQKSGCFWLFGIMCLVIVPCTYLFVPETKDKTFDVVRNNLLHWFPDFKNGTKFETALPIESPAVVMVKSISLKMSTENNHNARAEP